MREHAARLGFPDPLVKVADAANPGRGRIREAASSVWRRIVPVYSVYVVNSATRGCAHGCARARRLTPSFTYTSYTGTIYVPKWLKSPQNRRLRGCTPSSAAAELPLTACTAAIDALSQRLPAGWRGSRPTYGSGGGLTAECEQMMLQASRCRISDIMLSRFWVQPIDIAGVVWLTGRNLAKRALTFALCVQPGVRGCGASSGRQSRPNASLWRKDASKRRPDGRRVAPPPHRLQAPPSRWRAPTPAPGRFLGSCRRGIQSPSRAGQGPSFTGIVNNDSNNLGRVRVV